MQNKKYSPTALVFAAAITSAIWIAARLRFAVAGPGLAIAVGDRPNDHLLTVPFGFLSAEPSTAHAANAVALALLCALVYWLCSRRLQGGSVTLGLILASTTLVSPFASALLADPLGWQNAVALALFVVLLSDGTQCLRLPSALLTIMACALVVQDFLFLPAVAALLLRSRRVPATQFIAVTAAAGLALYVRVSVLHEPMVVHDSALRRVSVIGAAVFFLVMPLAAWNSRPNGSERDGDRSPRSLIAAALLGVASLFAATGDPSPYLLASQLAVGFWLAPSLGRLRAPLQGLIAIAAIALLVISSWKFPQLSPETHESMVLSRLHTAILANEPDTSCIIGNPDDLKVLSGSAVARYYESLYRHARIFGDPGCLSTSRAIISINGGQVRNYGTAGFALARAVIAQGTASMRLASRTYSISPTRRTHMPGGRGAFNDTTVTPLGKAASITIAAPFTVTFDCLRWVKGSTISFAVVDPLGGGDQADPVAFTILADRHAIYTSILKLWSDNKTPPWRFVRATLGQSTACGQLSFSVRAAGPRGLATWASFLAPAIAAPRTAAHGKQSK